MCTKAKIKVYLSDDQTNITSILANFKHSSDCKFKFENNLFNLRERINLNKDNHYSLPLINRPLLKICDKSLKIDYMVCNSSHKIKNNIIDQKGEDYY